MLRDTQLLDTEGMFEVESLVDERLCRQTGKAMFRVRWVGCVEAQDTWQFEEDLCPRLIQKLRDQRNDVVNWAQCDLCGRWRQLHPGQPVPARDEHWSCALSWTISATGSAACLEPEEAKGAEAAESVGEAPAMAPVAKPAEDPAAAAAVVSEWLPPGFEQLLLGVNVQLQAGTARHETSVRTPEHGAVEDSSVTASDVAAELSLASAAALPVEAQAPLCVVSPRSSCPCVCQWRRDHMVRVSPG